MDVKKIAVIGLGLIGGSLARALKERLHIPEIIAIDSDSASVDKALKDGSIDRGFTEIDSYIFDSDIVFIATPVECVSKYVDLLAGKVKPECILTDVGSTKKEIIDYISKCPASPCFIGGHPMAGSENTGYESGYAHLFENAYYILCPSLTADEVSKKTMINIVNAIGAIPIVIEADKHDRITGSISHIPHVVASALVNMVKLLDSEDDQMRMLAAGGFKDITRIASSSPEMWQNIILSNKQQVLELLRIYIDLLHEFEILVGKNDREKIYNFFDSARCYRNLFSSAKAGLISPIFDIIVDVVDKPGIIGEIATLLGSKSINIKNINVSNSREFEQGCLKITLPDLESVNSSYDLLISNGYKAYKIYT
jgi:prephenate dehydrogenase